MRILTGGESHGEALIAVIEGFPQGVRIEEFFIDQELSRRQKGYGRGKRMDIEKDKAHIVSGVRNNISMGSPITVMIKNKDNTILSQGKDGLEPVLVPRPGHADLVGALKYHDNDMRNMLERASARETAARVCAGSVCKQFLANFDITIASFVLSIGSVRSNISPESIEEIIEKTSSSSLSCVDPGAEKRMIEEIKDAAEKGDTLGGVIEVWVKGLCPGIGSFMHFDQRLDSKIAGFVMSIPAVKGVEIGAGFDYARARGSSMHDAIYFSPAEEGFYRKTNNAGGIEGGVSNGELLVIRCAMKPISTLVSPLDSVNIVTKKQANASVIRSDVCAVPACGVVAETMIALAVTECFLEKFGSDSLVEIKRNYLQYIKYHNPLT